MKGAIHSDLGNLRFRVRVFFNYFCLELKEFSQFKISY